MYDDTREACLAIWARKANEAHSHVLDSVRGAVGYANSAGVYLNAAKKHCNHGDWTAWLQENFHASVETARVYMQVARKWRKIQHHAESKHTTLAEALEIIRVPKKPKPKGTRNLSNRGDLKLTMGVAVETWSDEVVGFLANDNTILWELLEALKEELEERVADEIEGVPRLLICSTV